MKKDQSNEHSVIPFPGQKADQHAEEQSKVQQSPEDGSSEKEGSGEGGQPKVYEAAVMGAKIRALRKARNLSQPKLAAMLGITKNAVANWEIGFTRPQASMIPELCSILHCSANQLFGMPDGVRLNKDELKLVRKYRAANPTEQHMINVMLDTMLESHEEIFRIDCENKFLQVPFYDLDASAGTGNPLDDWEPDKEYEYLRINRDVCRADAVVTVSGDSMLPTFKNGEQILIQRTEAIDPGQIGIFVVNGDAYVKEYRRDGLHSHNPKYATIHLSEYDSVYCLGRVLSAVTDDMRPTLQEQKILDEIHRER